MCYALCIELLLLLILPKIPKSEAYEINQEYNTTILQQDKSDVDTIEQMTQMYITKAGSSRWLL